MNSTNTRPAVVGCAVMMVSLGFAIPALADATADAQAIRSLIARYKAVEQLFSNAPEVTFIHPLGEEHGRDQIEANIYRKLMGGTFFERKLSPKDFAIHVYGDSAWSEFHTQGRETQFYHRENGQWRIVHVHYSGAPVSGNLKGF